MREGKFSNQVFSGEKDCSGQKKISQEFPRGNLDKSEIKHEKLFWHLLLHLNPLFKHLRDIFRFLLLPIFHIRLLLPTREKQLQNHDWSILVSTRTFSRQTRKIYALRRWIRITCYRVPDYWSWWCIFLFGYRS